MNKPLRCNGRIELEQFGQSVVYTIEDGKRQYRYRCPGCARPGVANRPRKYCGRPLADEDARAKASTLKDRSWRMLERWHRDGQRGAVGPWSEHQALALWAVVEQLARDPIVERYRRWVERAGEGPLPTWLASDGEAAAAFWAAPMLAWDADDESYADTPIARAVLRWSTNGGPEHRADVTGDEA